MKKQHQNTEESSIKSRDLHNSSEDILEIIPPIPFVTLNCSSSDNILLDSMPEPQNGHGNKNYDRVYSSTKKSGWRKLFKDSSFSGHSNETDNHHTMTTASPSESSIYGEESTSESELYHRLNNPIGSMQPIPQNSATSSPEKSFQRLSSSRDENSTEESNDHSSYQNSTPNVSKQLFPTEKQVDISMVSLDIDDNDNTHFQSFILAIAFLAVWTPQNLMAPNLTQMADYFEFDSSQRDALLGANIAFATGVLSLPVSGSIGFLADVVQSRRNLYAFTVFVGGLASLCCGLSDSYTKLYFARFVGGGCMAGCTPVAFSLLGDLFETEERNMASSALTAMMGVGIIMGQVVAGMVGPGLGWRLPFHSAAVLCWISSIMVLILVKEPVRGGKEQVLQEMIKKGKAYDRKLTLDGFIHAMRHNRSNVILMLQGFFSSVPWGIIFVFLNDYLSQEQGLSVQDATFLVFIFGLGCAAGGLFGGAGGQYTSKIKISYLPIFMGVSTLLGIVPFLGLLDLTFHNASIVSMLLAFSGGLIANLPSVNVRPCLINVNPPEMRGAALTAANSVINLARGIGPSFLTWICSIYDVDRTVSFNMLIIVFWSVSALQLFWLADTLPHDKSKMEQELAQYASTLVNQGNSEDEYTEIQYLNYDIDDDSALVSIEDRMTTFDGSAIRESFKFISDTLKEVTNRSGKRTISDTSDSWEGTERIQVKTKAPGGWSKKMEHAMISNDVENDRNNAPFYATTGDFDDERTKLNMERSRSISAGALETTL